MSNSLAFAQLFFNIQKENFLNFIIKNKISWKEKQKSHARQNVAILVSEFQIILKQGGV